MIHCLLLMCVILALVVRNRGKQIQILPFLLLFFIAALRYMYGNDYRNYYTWHYLIHAGGKSPYDEVLFTLLNQVTPHFFVLIAVTSLVFILAVYRIMTDNLPQGWLVVGVFIFVINPYLYIMNLSAIRQCLAMILFMAAIPLAMEKKPLKYACIILIATMFHKSAIVLLPVYFFANTRQVRKRYVVSVTLCLLFSLFVFDIDVPVRWVAAQFDDANYIAHMNEGLGNSVRATLLSSLYLIYVLGNLPKLEGKALVYSKLYLLGTVLAILAFRVSMMTRIQMYFDIFSVVSLPLILKANTHRGCIVIRSYNVLAIFWDLANKYVLPVLLILVYILRYYSFFTNPMWKSFAEYHTIFSAF